MVYQFDFAAVWEYRTQLLAGAGHTLLLTAAGVAGGGLVGVLGGVARAWRSN